MLNLITALFAENQALKQEMHTLQNATEVEEHRGRKFCKAYGKICYKCHRKDHFARMCSSKHCIWTNSESERRCSRSRSSNEQSRQLQEEDTEVFLEKDIDMEMSEKVGVTEIKSGEKECITESKGQEIVKDTDTEESEWKNTECLEDKEVFERKYPGKINLMLRLAKHQLGIIDSDRTEFLKNESHKRWNWSMQTERDSMNKKDYALLEAEMAKGMKMIRAVKLKMERRRSLLDKRKEERKIKKPPSKKGDVIYPSEY